MINLSLGHFGPKTPEYDFSSKNWDNFLSWMFKLDDNLNLCKNPENYYEWFPKTPDKQTNEQSIFRRTFFSLGPTKY